MSRQVKFHLAVVYVLLTLSVCVNFLQGRRLLELSGTLNAQQRAVIEGQTVPVLHVKDSSGRPYVIGYSKDALPTVLYFFSPSCPWCRRNSPAATSLAQQLSGKYRFVALSLHSGGVAQFVERYSFNVPTYTNPEAS